MEYKLIIDGRLPDLNDYLKAERQVIRSKGRFTTKGNEMKQTEQDRIIWQIRSQLRRVRIHKQVDIKYTFYEPNRKRDKDNISSFAHKVIQDSLVCSGVLDNDGWKNIGKYTDSFDVDKENPRIEVTIVEVGD